MVRLLRELKLLSIVESTWCRGSHAVSPGRGAGPNPYHPVPGDRFQPDDPAGARAGRRWGGLHPCASRGDRVASDQRKGFTSHVGLDKFEPSWPVLGHRTLVRRLQIVA